MLRWFAIGLALTACESAPQATAESPAQPQPAHSREQLEAAASLQLAIMQGRLADARDLAGQLAVHEMPARSGWQPYVAELRDSAHLIARADDVAAAGAELGRLGRACGSCHAASGARPVLAAGVAPTDDTTLAAQMLRHQWAAVQLWQGVSGPADQAWQDGARVMVATRADVHKRVHEKPNAEVFMLAERLHEQARHAAALTDVDARAGLYGEVMATCASCHTIMRPHPVVERAPLVSTRTDQRR
ncbi:MAG TPA: hypothetical protein VIV11_19175 [Kofleriaceae bacterium]